MLSSARPRITYDEYCVIEVRSRGADGTWTRTEHREGSAPLASIRCELPVADVYADPLS